jgi:hypothetical protein
MGEFDDLKPKGLEEIPHKEAKDLIPKPMEETDPPPSVKQTKLNISDLINILISLFRNKAIEIQEGKTTDLLPSFSTAKIILMAIAAIVAVIALLSK